MVTILKLAPSYVPDNSSTCFLLFKNCFELFIHLFTSSIKLEQDNMTSFGWKRKAGDNVSKSAANKFKVEYTIIF